MLHETSVRIHTIVEYGKNGRIYFAMHPGCGLIQDNVRATANDVSIQSTTLSFYRGTYQCAGFLPRTSGLSILRSKANVAHEQCDREIFGEVGEPSRRPSFIVYNFAQVRLVLIACCVFVGVR